MVSAGLADRCEVRGGDFFAEVPAGGDAYILSWSIHDWDHCRATTILERCRPPGATALRGTRHDQSGRPSMTLIGEAVGTTALRRKPASRRSSSYDRPGPSASRSP